MIKESEKYKEAQRESSAETRPRSDSEEKGLIRVEDILNVKATKFDGLQEKQAFANAFVKAEARKRRVNGGQADDKARNQGDDAQVQQSPPATPQPKLSVKVFGEDRREQEESPESMKLLGQGFVKDVDSAKRIHKKRIEIAKTRAAVVPGSRRDPSRRSPDGQPEFVRLAERERRLLKVHHEFSNEFDPNDKLTKKSESNLHLISFKPPLSGASRPGIVHKESAEELKRIGLKRALDHNYLNKRPTIPGQQIPGLGSRALNTWQRIDFENLEAAGTAPAKPPVGGIDDSADRRAAKLRSQSLK